MVLLLLLLHQDTGCLRPQQTAEGSKPAQQRMLQHEGAAPAVAEAEATAA